MQSFAQQIVNIIEREPFQSDIDSSYYVRFSIMQSGEDIVSDADLFLGFYTPVVTSVQLQISNKPIVTVQTKPGEYQPLFDNGICIPLLSLQNHYVTFVFDSPFPVYGIFGYVVDFSLRLDIALNSWKFIDTINNIFFVKCDERSVKADDNICCFEDIEHVPLIQPYIDRCYEKWKERKCHAYLNVILEELIARTWHPSRHIDWCLDADDKKMLGFS